MAANRGYDVVVDVDEEVCEQRTRLRDTVADNKQGDLGHTDLQEDNLQFHQSSQSLYDY